MPIEVSYVAYKRILDSMCRIILKHVLDGSDGFKMPFGLGYIQVGKYKPKSYTNRSLSIDFKTSNELGISLDYTGLEYLRLFQIDTNISYV